MTTSYVEENEEEVRKGILYNLVAQQGEYIGEGPLETDELYLAQSHVITSIADAESCVIVGRLSNFVLARRPHCFHVYVHAPLETRIQRVMEREGLDRGAAREKIEHIDGARARRCMRLTGEVWGRSGNYHMSIDTSLYGTEGTAQLIVDAITDAEKRTLQA